MSRRDGGFTLIEVMIAMVMLTIGILVLASSGAGITRMLTSGQRKTKSAALAASRLELLRTYANSTSPKCSSGSLVSGTATTTTNFTETWTVSGSGTGTGTSRTLQVIVSYQYRGRSLGDTLVATINCG